MLKFASKRNSTLKRARVITALCGLLSATSAFAATPADTLVMAWNIDRISTFDPASIGNVHVTEILYNTCDLLADFKVDDESKLVPVLAEKWDVSEDRKQITFHLKRGVNFASGNPMTAQDVLYSIYRVVDIGKANSSKFTEYGYTAKNIRELITAPDDHTVVVKMDKPYPPTLLIQSIFANPVTAIMDSKFLERQEVNGDKAEKYLTTNTACIGPYKLVRWNPGEGIMLQTSENYWRELPKLKRILIRHVSEGGTQRLLLEKNDVDVARDLSSDDIDALEKNPAVSIEKGLRPQLYMWQLNTAGTPFSDPKVRLAMRYLVDYDGLGKTVMRNTGTPRASFVPLGAFGALDQAKGQPFKLDLAKAKELLKEAGYADGFSASIIIGTDLYEGPVAQSVQQNAAQIGVKLSIERMANSQLVTRVRNRDYQSHMATWQRSVTDAHGNASRLVFNPSNDPALKLGDNRAWTASYYSEKANAMVEAALLEPDQAKREAMYKDLQQFYFEDGSGVVMFQTYNVAGIRKELKGWAWNSMRTYYNLFRK
ncbi:ABC transporter substrate-binding protein [Brucella intermedia]|uniref:ABC transporter substrate-binding protein n=1 Tax=Brucella intermedia TaxID=94625 RepID=UPI00224A8D65|nr:ABC transporter substrate-binding protein [Brucella intermedia]